MNFAAIELALITLASALTGVEASCCVFENAPRPLHNGRLVRLAWVSSDGLGLDAATWEFATNADPLLEMTPVVEGARFLVLQVSVESFAQTPGETARAAAELARSRVRFPSSLAALRAVGLALADVGAVTTADYRSKDGRMVSRCLVELRLNGVAREVDEAGRTSYIATAGVTGTITRPDGAALDEDLQPTGTVP